MLALLFLSLGYLVATAVAGVACQLPDELTVKTTTGIVRGTIDPNERRVRQFLGIPFAEAPVGDRRFASPEAITPWTGVTEATSMPLSCPQTNSNKSASIYIQNVLELNVLGLNHTPPFTEDCLTLSIWAPNKKVKAASLPVLIWIYGGGFTHGGMNVPYQIPTQWVARSQEHIVVAMNYRVNIMGFPGSRGLDADKLNLGLLDQRLAVEWIAANIAAFGGDPKRMVLWGQSAGAASVAAYSYSYPDDPLVMGFIQDSGTTGIIGTSQAGETGSEFSIVANGVDCGGLSPVEELACMRKVPVEKLQAFIEEYGNAGTQPALMFQPIPDEKLVFKNWTDRALNGHVAKLPTILGTNKDEGAFEAYDPNDPKQVAIFNETLKSGFLCPAADSARLRGELDLPIYRYRYAGNFTNISPTTWLGAYHSAELPMLFGTHPNYRGDSTPEEYALSAKMQDLWVAFARDGTAGLEASDWPRYDNSTGQGLILQLGLGNVGHTETADWLERTC